MAHYGHLEAQAAVDEQPNENYYTVRFFGHGKDDRPVAEAHIRVNTMTFAVGAVALDRLQPDALGGLSDGELLKIAEVEMNRIPGLLNYVEIPGDLPEQP